MKKADKFKRLFAILGVIILVSLYALTLIFALIDIPNWENFFFASLYATVIIPFLIFAYSFIYKLLKQRDK